MTFTEREQQRRARTANHAAGIRLRFWQFALDCSILVTRWADRLYLTAWHKVYPPRASDAEQVRRAVYEDMQQ